MALHAAENPNSNPNPNGSGFVTPESLEHQYPSNAPIHPTATRRNVPIIVHSLNTAYSNEHITAKFEYRGAQVVEQGGTIQVTPTVEKFEFRTVRKVQKTGYILFLFSFQFHLEPVFIYLCLRVMISCFRDSFR